MKIFSLVLRGIAGIRPLPLLLPATPLVRLVLCSVRDDARRVELVLVVVVIGVHPIHVAIRVASIEDGRQDEVAVVGTEDIVDVERTDVLAMLEWASAASIAGAPRESC